MKRTLVVAIVLMLALVLTAPMATAKNGGEQTGNTKQIGELSAAWWQQVLNEPSAPKCGTLDKNTTSGNVFYLANFTGTVDTSCTVPSGSKVLFPTINFACSPQLSDPFTTEKDLRNECSSILNYATKGATGVFATVDGKDVTDRVVCAESPLFNLTVPDNSFSVAAGFGKAGTGPAVANGCWVLLQPLSVGEHKITFGGTFPLDPEFFPSGPSTFTQDATYTLTVVPDSKKK